MRSVSLLLIFLSIGAVNADILTVYHVRNFNTMQPIEGVDAVLHNSTFTISNVTDINGYVWFPLDDTGNFTVDFSIVAYESKSIQRESFSNSTEEIFLNPQSTNGIIKLHMNDLTMGEHTTCIYYGINGRLKECDAYNETGAIQIYTSTNYTFKPVFQRADMISTPSNIVRYYKLWLPLLAGIAFVATVIALLLGMTIRIYKGGRKR